MNTNDFRGPGSRIDGSSITRQLELTAFFGGGLTCFRNTAPGRLSSSLMFQHNEIRRVLNRECCDLFGNLFSGLS